MFTVCTLYQFVTLSNFTEMRLVFTEMLVNLDIKGTILLAREGINATISGRDEVIKKFLNYLNSDTRFATIEAKFSYSNIQPFRRLRVRLKKEIVMLGVSKIDPKKNAGRYVMPKDWNKLISDPEVLLIDSRNDYEYKIGSFKGAINPNIKTFRDFPNYVKQNLDVFQHKRIAMFCTGGIRCEKASAYLKINGFKEVYHLAGGILKYLEDVRPEESFWQGECFVFDERVALTHQLKLGSYNQCHACRYPITKTDKKHSYYEHGVSCPRCFGNKTPRQIIRYREREKQMRLAAKKNIAHIGDEASCLVNKKIRQNG